MFSFCLNGQTYNCKQDALLKYESQLHFTTLHIYSFRNRHQHLKMHFDCMIQLNRPILHPEQLYSSWDNQLAMVPS